MRFKKGRYMKKILIVFLMTFGILNAGLVDAIALVVNEDPITVYDIDKKMSDAKVNKKDAVSILVDELLYEQELKKNYVTVDMFDVNNYIEQVAANNKMDIYEFKSIIKQKFKDYSKYENKIKKDLLRQKLLGKVLRGKLKMPTDTDLKIYYENNLNSFSSASTFSVVQYATKDKKALLAIKKNPMLNIPSVNKQNLVLKQEELSAQFKYLLNETETKKFTPIFTANKNYAMLFIIKKENLVINKLEEVKRKISQIIIQENEKKYLQDYFEKLKITADIRVVR